MTAGLTSSVSEVSGESKLELGSSPGGSFGGSPSETPGTPEGFWMGMYTEQGGEWKLVVGEASPLGHSLMHAQSQRLNMSSRGRDRGSLLLTEREAMEMFGRLRIMLVASKKAKGIKMGRCLCVKGTGLRTSMSTHRSESMVNKYEFEYTVKTGFTLEVTLRKSRVEGG